MDSMQTPILHCDICILGGGLAGNMQARHLKLKCPKLSVVMVEDRTDEEIEKSRKVGESTVDIAGTFLARDLALHDYLIDHQLPKHGLNFHFPDGTGKTEALSDYISYLNHFLVGLPAFQLERRTIERDLLKMNMADGVSIIRPQKVRQVSREKGIYTIETESVRDRSKTTIRAKWIIDATGRKRFLNNTLVRDNVQIEPKPNTASFWVRIKNPDRSPFHETLQDERTFSAPYYATNHFFGTGYWIWTIPLKSDELSVGIVFDKDIIPIKEMFGREKFFDFLKKEQKIIYDISVSGEVMDELALNHLPYRAKQFYSKDRWALIGDAASFVDPFLSLGTSITSIGISQVTELIRMDLIERCSPKKLSKYIKDYDYVFGFYHDRVVEFYRNMYHFAEDPRPMQEKIHFNVRFWFKVIIPVFITKIFLRPFFLKVIKLQSFRHVNSLLDELFLKMKNSDYTPKFIKQMYRINEAVKIDYLNDCIFDSWSYNPFPELIGLYWYSLKLRSHLLWKLYGKKFIFQKKQLLWIAIHFFEMLISIPMSIGASIYCFRRNRNQKLEEQSVKFRNFKKVWEKTKVERAPIEDRDMIPEKMPDLTQEEMIDVPKDPVVGVSSNTH